MNATIIVKVVIYDDNNESHVETRSFHRIEDAISFMDSSSTPAWIEAVDEVFTPNERNNRIRVE